MNAPIKSSNPDSNIQSMPSRRQFLTVGVGADFAVAGSHFLTGCAVHTHSPETVKAAPPIADSAYFFNEGLAVPFNSKSFGAGKERAMVLGGGGEYWVAWMLGYFHALKSNGANLDLPDVYVGTSAESIISSLLSGTFNPTSE
jgi:NTE family protein